MILGIKDLKLFKLFFECVYDKTDDVVFNCTANEVSISLLNKAHTCYYNVKYDKEFFEVYDVDGVEVVAISIDDLYKILKTASNNDYLELSTDDYHIIAKFESEHDKRVFELVQSADYADTPEPLVVPTDTYAILRFDSLKQSLSDLDIFKVGQMQICVEDEILKFKTISDISNIVYENTVNALMIDGESSVKIDTEYLNSILIFKGLSNNIELAWSTDTPLLWKSSSMCVEVNGLIAPRIGE